METGYFYASDKDDHVFTCEATQKMVKQDIDQRGHQWKKLYTQEVLTHLQMVIYGW